MTDSEFTDAYEPCVEGKEMTRFAHSIPGRPEAEWEPLEHHLAAVGESAAAFAEVFGLAGIGRAMGLLHDIGKQSGDYQRYIRQPEGVSAAKGPDHSTAGAQEAAGAYGRVLGRLMAYGIAGHHGGLMDGAGLSARLAKAVPDFAG